MLVAVIIANVCQQTASKPLPKNTRPGKKTNAVKIKTELEWGNIIFIAVLLGTMPYFNLPVAGIGVMFVGLFSLVELLGKNKAAFSQLFIAAFIGGLLVLPQLIIFQSNSSGLSDYPQIRIGFAAGPTFKQMFEYYWHTIGIKIALYVIAFFLLKGRRKLEIIIWFIPFVVANIFQLGTVFYDNNKLMWISLMFMNAYTAWVIMELIRLTVDKLPESLQKIKNINIWFRQVTVRVGILLILVCSATGITDFIGVKNLRMIKIEDRNSSLRQWLEGNTTRDAVFMSWTHKPYHDTPISTVNLAGRMLFNVCSDVDSSVDIEPRRQFALSMYQGEWAYDVNGAFNRLRDEKVDYIIIDPLLRAKFNEENRALDEHFFDANFELVYNQNDTKIFKVPA
jgi:hypothetical protein